MGRPFWGGVMSRYFRAGKVPAMKKEDTYSGKGREQERACFGDVPGGVIRVGLERGAMEVSQIKSKKLNDVMPS